MLGLTGCFDKGLLLGSVTSGERLWLWLGLGLGLGLKVSFRVRVKGYG